MIEITDRQQETLTYIIETRDKLGYPPTITEMAYQAEVTRGTIQGRLRALESKGFVSRGFGTREITVLKEI